MSQLPSYLIYWHCNTQRGNMQLKISLSMTCPLLIEVNHTYKNIDNNMNILHVHTKDRKLDTLEPVSYTHLDVYKRQILPWPCLLHAFSAFSCFVSAFKFGCSEFVI